MHALFNALGGPHRNPEQLDPISEFLGGAQIFRLDRRDALHIDRALGDPGAKGETGEDCKFLRGIMSIDIERRIGLRITEPLRIFQAFGE